MKEENEKFQEYLDKAEKLDKMDFSEKEEKFDVEEYYKAIKNISDENNNIKNQEAENVIKEFAPRYFNEQTIKAINTKKDAFLNYIRKYDPNTDLVKNMNIYDVDKIFAISNYILNSYIQYLNDVPFTFRLKGEEIKFLNKILTKSIEYNGDDVFNYVKLYSEFWEAAYIKYEEDKSKEIYEYELNIQMILILHHLIKEYKVKGSGNEFRYFRDVLYRIAETNKLFNAYNVGVERLKENSKTWGAALDAVVSPQDPENQLAQNENTQIKELAPEDVKRVEQ